MNIIIFIKKLTNNKPVAQTGGHGASKTKVMGSILKNIILIKCVSWIQSKSLWIKALYTKCK